MSPTKLGIWVQETFDIIFYQPDDNLSIQAFEDSMSLDLRVSVNGKWISRDAWKGFITAARSKYWLSVKENRELLANTADGGDGEGVGTVSHFFTVVMKDKQTGCEKESVSQTIISVARDHGKLAVTELTEVMV